MMRNTKKFRLFGAILMVLVLIVSIGACGRKESKSSYDAAFPEADYGTAGNYNGMDKADYTTESSMKDTKGSYEEESPAAPIANTSTVTSAAPTAQTQEKIIRNISMDLETQEFDELINNINDEISRLGGYVENSNISGRRYHRTNVLRHGSIVARIPKTNLDEFVGAISDVSNVVNKTESSQNVTLQYVDTESHIKVLKIEQEKLYELLGKTGTLEDILTLESRLSTIRYELERYESQLRLYDNMVEYSTVNLSVEEVERFTPKEEVKPSVFSRIKTGFNDTMYDISEGFKDIVVGVSINIPYILFWVAVLLITVLLIRRGYRKMRIKYQSPKQPDNSSENNNMNN